MRRQRRPVVIRLKVHDKSAAGQDLARHAGQYAGERLRLRVRDNGRVRARLGYSTRYNTPPVLVGRIAVGPDGAELTATIREPYTELGIPRLFLGIAVFLGLVCVAILASGDFTNPGVYVCGIGGTALGLIGLALGRTRRTSFDHHADQLEQAVRAAARR
ncbi:hypothetical protein [Dactylosporangium matsuzakiense]|uniref:Uncharacterized protein n=1 Tax=Dactylosporangium matsuzakiense TaxID=53360 RepID=A0A9W6NSY1_9ACTN|nr:hypothetical protein [Dactylosporangium matsuzakiense]UWZ48345.1 hypothetical protein Dmats_19205 [Dactylosporangium matsuzakiense]GLL07617.1 hypothetical protein GCM10017581_093710 [Dactylosporangium matsuzakiense]